MCCGPFNIATKNFNFSTIKYSKPYALPDTIDTDGTDSNDT